MRNLLLLALGIAIGAVSLAAVWAAQDGDVTVRVSVLPHEDGRVEVGIQHRNADGEWVDAERPQYRFLSADAESGVRLHSSEVTIPVATAAEQAAIAYREYLEGEGAAVGQFFAEYLTTDDDPADDTGEAVELGAVLCIVDPNDAGVGALCDGLAAAYTISPVERIEIADWDALRAELEQRFNDGSTAAVLTTSVPTTMLGWEIEAAAGQWFPWIYWIELLDQHLAPSDALFCQITHSGRVIAEDGEDLFWGLSSEVSAAAGAQLGVNLRFNAYSNAAEQAAAIQECVDDQAAAIATTLVEPDVLAPAIDAALAADIPVVSFNSGAEIADQTGTALHIALDDHEAGRLAAEEFNRRAVDGTVLCVIHEPNNVGLHDRCNGFEEVYAGAVERWSAADPAASIDELGARLLEGDIAAVLTLSVDSAWEARVARARNELDVPIAAFGFSMGLVNSVLNESVMFTILDHPEMQIYLSAVAAVIAERWRLDPVAYFNGLSLLIRPQIADAAYMEALVDSMFAN